MLELTWLVRLRFQRDLAERDRQKIGKNGADDPKDLKETKDAKAPDHSSRVLNARNH